MIIDKNEYESESMCINSNGNECRNAFVAFRNAIPPTKFLSKLETTFYVQMAFISTNGVEVAVSGTYYYGRSLVGND